MRYIRRVRWGLHSYSWSPLGEGAVVHNEAMQGLRANRAGTRPFALLLLLTLSIYSAYGLSPLMTSRCGCEHGPEVPCDCPHHGSAHDSAPAPCQLHKKARPAANLPSQPILRARCGSIPPHLILVTVFSTAERPQLIPSLPPVRPGVFSPLPPPDVFRVPLKHPPKARA
jgi:hypothetical protein